MAVFHGLQDKFGYVPRESLEELSELSKISTTDLFGALTFYSYFRTEPPEKITLRLCRSLVCRMAGEKELASQCRTLGDSFHTEEVSCLGLCDNAPAAHVNEKPLPKASFKKIRKRLVPV